MQWSTLAQGVENAVGDPRELGGDLVRDVQRVLHHLSVGGVSAAADRPGDYVAAMERKWWTLVTVCVATFMLLLDITIVNVALPAIERALDAIVLRSAVGRRRLCARPRDLRPDRRGARRPLRAQAAVPDRRRAVHGRLGGLRRRERPAVPDHRARRAGARRRADVRDRARAPLAGVPRARARHGVRPLGRDDRRRRRRSGRSPAACSPRGSRGAGSSSSTSRSASARSSSARPSCASRATPSRPARPARAGHADRRPALPDPRADRGQQAGLDEHRHHRASSSGRSSCSAAFIATQATERVTMIDLSLFKRPAFVGAQVTAFAISSTLFAMFLYITLYLQNILGLSPLADRRPVPAAQPALVRRRPARRAPLDRAADPRAARHRASRSAPSRCS